MELFIIVSCLLSERYLIHQISYQRFSWFNAYYQTVCAYLQQSKFGSNSLVIMIGVILPILLIVGSVLYILQVIVFGVLAFCLNFVIFYYCLGPHNVFYGESEQASDYFAIANNQLFAVIFWYIVLGPIAILLYRLIDLCQQQDLVKNSSKCILDLLDWIPTRITTLFYLLAGNFQNGFSFWLK